MKRKASLVEDEDVEVEGESHVEEEGKLTAAQLNAVGVAEVIAKGNQDAMKLFLARVSL